MGTEKSHKISGDPSIDSKVKGLHPSSSTGFFFRVLTSRSGTPFWRGLTPRLARYVDAASLSKTKYIQLDPHLAS